MTAEILVDGELQTRTAAGNGPIDAFLKILGEDGQDVRVLDYTEHALSEGGSAMAAAYVEAAVGDRWVVVDATRLAPRSSLVRISSGADASETSFLTTHTGGLSFGSITVTATVEGADLPVDDHEGTVAIG